MDFLKKVIVVLGKYLLLSDMGFCRKHRDAESRRWKKKIPVSPCLCVFMKILLEKLWSELLQ